ncbi:glyoxalase/bleomycin resistance/extradiol dioxygenase family protein [Bordetella genomosp. 8]|uniref:Glyoxalase/bleomycin resistance/extradiol dioxygenase family protein n=1 Tax=Bordetella genomosp. 8 TaxID=1416806 RepID=A0A1W6YMS8_9BORD|nr:VOC family protein [Bordetella genomosp. 8]ARP82348.1 glyoxalase/bleomycin resistance/extradiol dioxygenase family protein [Bordetella genomosp. 8]
MFDHIGIRSCNPESLEAFFLRALAPLGVTIAMRGPHGSGLGMSGKPSLWIYATAEKPTPLHLAFAAEHRSQVDAFYAAAIAAGGQDNGPPALRPHYHPHYYAAFVIGPDGHNVEVVCHRPEA